MKQTLIITLETIKLSAIMVIMTLGLLTILELSSPQGPASSEPDLEIF